MKLTFNPEDASRTIPAGEYEAVIRNIAEKTSKKSGEPMLEVNVQVFCNGRSIFLTDYATDYLHSGLWKLAQIANAIGLGNKFKSGEMDTNELLEKNCRVKLKIEEARDQFPESNKIQKYLPTDVVGLPEHVEDGIPV